VHLVLKFGRGKPRYECHYSSLNGTTLLECHPAVYILPAYCLKVATPFLIFWWDSAPHASNNSGKLSLAGTCRPLSLAINNHGQHDSEFAGCRLQCYSNHTWVILIGYSLGSWLDLRHVMWEIPRPRSHHLGSCHVMVRQGRCPSGQYRECR